MGNRLRKSARPYRTLIVGWLLLTITGCGTIKGRSATDQLLLSDAVDRTISQINFQELTGQKVYLDSRYIKSVRTGSFVNADYIVSSLRELLIRDGCLLEDGPQEADFIVEIRVGALGTDSHEINYGVPGNTAINQTASMLSSTPLPAIPEISLAKRDDTRAAAKISLYAYHRESKEPVWQTGTIVGHSNAKSTWILGAGPFNEGTIYDQAPLRTSPVDVPQFRVDALADHRSRLGRLGELIKPPKSTDKTEQVYHDRFSVSAIAREQATGIVSGPVEPPQLTQAPTVAPTVQLTSAEVPMESLPTVQLESMQNRAPVAVSSQAESTVLSRFGTGK